jgi:uncharacterized membrane protein
MRKIRWSCAPFFGFLLALFALQLPIAAQGTAKPGNRITNVIDDRLTVARPLDVHRLARKEFDEGEASPDTRMERMVLVLAPAADQQRELEELFAAQQDPESPEYHRWVTPEAFGSRFGISATDLDQIVNWLKTHGFEVEPVSPARRSIVFSGSVAQVASAFHTAIHVYNVSGKRHYANAAPPAIPEALAEVVRGVVSLHDFHARPMHRVVGPIARASAAPLLIDNLGNHYLAPADFAGIYNVGPLYANSIDGTGQAIAIVGRTNINVPDVQTFRNYFSLPANAPTIVLNGTDPGIVSQDEESEAILDVEWSGAVAPKAAIQLVVSASTYASDGVTLSAEYIVNQNLAAIVSTSFGSCERDMGTSENQFWNGLWQQAALQGMTVLVSSGDSGVAGCDLDSGSTATNPQSVNGLCSSPFSTCVGGTAFNDIANPGAYWTPSGSAVGYIPETAWNQSGSVAGGSDLWASGPSMVYPKPTWQTGPGVPSDGWRDVPDVALSAATHDGYVTYMQGSYYADGGTSASAPSFAGLLALAAQQTGARLGNVNATLYTLAANQGSSGSGVFHDITAGNKTVPGLAGYNAGAGYDLATGLGSVDAAQLLNHWGDAATSASFHLSTSPASVSLLPGASATVAVGLTESGGFQAPVALSATGLPSGLTASFSPAIVPAGSASSTLTLTAGALAASGAQTVTIAASGAGINRYLPVVVNISPCTYTISPTSAAPASTAAIYTVHVTAPTVCSWTAVSNSSWLTIAGDSSGSGSGSFAYSVAANTGTTGRSGAIAVAGLTLAVTQAAAAFSLNPLTANDGAAAAVGSVTVTAASSTASWTAVSNVAWLTITSAASNTGNRTVSYSVAANTAPSTRTGTLTIAGQAFTVTQAAAVPGFTLSAAPSSLAVQAGSSVTMAIGVAGAGGFQGSVNLAASGLPAGVTATFTPAAVAPGATSTLKLTAAASAVPSTSNVTLNGTSGSLTGTAPLSLTVTVAPGLSVSATPSSVALGAGSSATTAVSVAAVGDFTGNVTLAVSGLPAGVTAAFNPAAIAPGGTATLKLTAAASVASSSGTITLTGSGGSLTCAASIGLSVAATGFTLSASLASVSVTAGSSATTNVSVAGAGGFNGTVTPSISGLPAGVTAAFTPAVLAVGGSSQLTLTAAATAATSAANLTLSGASGSLKATAPLSLNVTAASGFTLSASPSSIGLVKGASATTSVSVAAKGNFTGNVALALSGLPTGVTAAFTPAAVAPGSISTLTLTAAASATASSANLTLSGTSGNLTGATALSLSVAASGFTLSATPSTVALVAGSSATTSVSVAAKSNFTGRVILGVSGLPTGVTATFTPTALAMGGTAMLKLAAAASAGLSSGNVTLTGSSGSLTGTTPITLSVTPPPAFTLTAASSSLTMAVGSAATTGISVAGTGGFSGNVAMAVSGLPAGVTATLTPASIAAGGTSTLQLTAALTAAVSSGNLTLTGSSGSLKGTTTIGWGVTAAPGLSLTDASSSVTVAAGTSAATSIHVAGTGGFTGSVTLAVSGLPPGVAATFTPASVAAGGVSTLTVTAAASAAVSSLYLTLTGSSGNLTGTTRLGLSVTPAPGFTLTAAPPSVTITAGSSTTTSIHVTGSGGFAGNVTMALSGLPTGVTAAFTPASIAPGGTSTLKLTAALTATASSGSLTLTGSSGSLTSTIPIGLSVTPAPGFTLTAAPSSLTVGAGLSATSSISVTGIGGFTGNVALAVSGLPAGVTATFTPASVAAGVPSTLKLTASSSAPLSSGNLTLTGSSGSLTATAPISLSVTVYVPPSFTLQLASPSFTVGFNVPASTTLSVVPAGGFAGKVTLAATGLPCGVAAVFTPPTVQAGSTARLTLTSYYGSVITTNIVITGTSGSLSATTSLHLTANTEYVGFQLFASPVFVDLKPGGTATTTISMQPWLGFTGTGTLSAPILPPGVTATFNPSTIGPGITSTLTLTASAFAPAPTGFVQVQGAIGHATMGLLRITVNNDVPGFSLEPPYMPVSTLTEIIDTSVVVDFSGGFSDPIQFSFSGLPPGVIGSFLQFPDNMSNVRDVQFELAAGVTAVPTPSTPITITGTSGNLTASTTFNLAVAPTNNFSINPPVQLWSSSDYFTTPVGGTATARLLGIDNGLGFTVSVTGAPPTATTTLVAAPPSEYVLNVATTNQTAPGCYVINYVGNAPGQPPYTKGWPLYLTVTE